MGFQVLARKWRPKAFSEIVGQEHVVKALTNALTQQRLHHAYLFTGTRGVGKTTLARILAKALNCETGVTATPCGKCGACVDIDGGRFVDLMEVDAATNTKVEEMRELLDQAQYMPVAGRFKVYIIDEVHMLSRSAFNSMLKTLEEPPEHVKFILATTDPQKVPITVLSRCLQFNLKQMPPDLIVKRLSEVLQAEKIDFEPGALRLLARAAQGSMRDSLSLLDQAIAHGGGAVGVEQVTAMLGVIDQEYLYDLLDCVAAQDAGAMMRVAEQMTERSLSFDDALQALAGVLHAIAVEQTVPEASERDAAGFDRIASLALKLTPDSVQLYYQIALNGRRDLPLAPDEYAGFTMTLMRMLAFAIEDGTQASRPQAPVASAPREAKPARAALAAASAAATAVVESPHAKPHANMPLDNARPARAATAARREFDGDWLALVAKLDAGGMVGMLASDCELKGYQDGEFQLIVPGGRKHLLEKPYPDKLKASMEAYLGVRVRLNFSVGETNGSPAAIADREQRERQARAEEAIEKDGFVRALVDTMDAKLIRSSIKPV
jgi:DNA polymerase III subunit gamma/tau